MNVHVYQLGPPFGGDIRLRGGRTTTEGRIEIFRSNQWNTVCDSAITGDIGKFVCQHLKYSYASTVYNAYFGLANASMPIVSANCPSNATNTNECVFQDASSISSKCTHGSDVGVICSSKYDSKCKMNF